MDPVQSSLQVNCQSWHNVGCPDSISSATSTTTPPDLLEGTLQEGFWDDIPIDDIEPEVEEPVQHWWDESAQCMRVLRVYPDAPDTLKAQLPKAVFDGVWTPEEEARLQKQWESHPLRQALQRARSPSFAGDILHQNESALVERELWENTCFYFGCPPSDIISAQHRMMVVADQNRRNTRMIPNAEATGSGIYEVLWGKAFCRNLNDLLLNNHWAGQPSVLREAIKYTVFCTSAHDDRRSAALMPVIAPAKSEKLNLFYMTVELLVQQNAAEGIYDKKAIRPRARTAANTAASVAGKTGLYLVRASDLELMMQALGWIDFWGYHLHFVPSSDWKGLSRRLRKPWAMLSYELHDYGLDQVYLDVLRQYRRWEIEARTKANQ
ncbi:hypothetical protein QBC43DRAFT_111200 [Cladorrhinum sp. PSN259]|nr:hypothetical protein QBC43DRAFT_111200 [Cladorrhinum sp. PSN259]